MLFHHLVLTGDLFDEGKWCPPEEFEYYVKRFQSLFYVDEKKTQIHVVAGNHDIGFHYAVTPYLDKRFRDAFQTKSVELKVIKGVRFVMINSMAMHGDGCFLCTEAVSSLKKLKRELYNSNETSQPILLSHFPLYRKSDAHCNEPDEAPKDEKNVKFREGWDCITQESSNLLVESLKPRLVFSGHTHHGCNTTHKNGEFQEINISSFSWRNKKNPAFLLAYFSKKGHSISKCYMPDENTVYSVYVFFIALMMCSLVKK